MDRHSKDYLDAILQQSGEPTPLKLSENLQSIKRAKKLYVYGHGSGFQTFKVFVADKFGLSIDVIVDKSVKEEFEHQNTLFTSTRHLSKCDRSTFQDSMIVITLGDRNQQKVVIKKLLALGFKTNNILLALDIREYHFSFTPKSQILHAKSIAMQGRSEILPALDRFYDKKSKDLFVRILSFYLGYSPAHIPNSDFLSQYLPTDLPFDLNRNIFKRIIDIGCYKGSFVDSIIQLNRQGKALTQVMACFEPNLSVFKTTSEKYARTRDNQFPILFFPLALDLGFGEKLFMKNNLSNSHLIHSLSKRVKIHEKWGGVLFRQRVSI